MASKTVLLDDLDPTAEATETILFSVDGVFHEIDLGDKNAASLRSALAKFVKVARPVLVRDAVKQLTTNGDFDPQVVRAWLIAKGRQVNDKGRIPQELVTEWVAAGRPNGTAK